MLWSLIAPNSFPLNEDDNRRVLRARIALKTGWTYDYIDSLDMQDKLDVLGVDSAIVRYQNIEIQKQRRRSNRGNRR